MQPGGGATPSEQNINVGRPISRHVISTSGETAQSLPGDWHFVRSVSSSSHAVTIGWSPSMPEHVTFASATHVKRAANSSAHSDPDPSSLLIWLLHIDGQASAVCAGAPSQSSARR